MSKKSKSVLIILVLTIIFLVGCEAKEAPTATDVESDSFTLAALNGVPSDTSIKMNSWPTEITLASNDKNVTRKIDIVEKDNCTKKHPFGFETYSGEFTTNNGQQLNRLSYPEVGADSLFVVDEYGYILDNGRCLTFSYTSVLSDVLSANGEYSDIIYNKELDIAAKIMDTLVVPSN